MKILRAVRHGLFTLVFLGVFTLAGLVFGLVLGLAFLAVTNLLASGGVEATLLNVSNLAPCMYTGLLVGYVVGFVGYLRKYQHLNIVAVSGLFFVSGAGVGALLLSQYLLLTNSRFRRTVTTISADEIIGGSQFFDALLVDLFVLTLPGICIGPIVGLIVGLVVYGLSRSSLSKG